MSTLQQSLLDIAARSAGLPHDCSFGGFRDTRSVEPVQSWGADSDTRLALASARDALLRSLTEIHARFVEGDPDVIDQYERHMRTLARLVGTWAALHTGTA